MSMYKKTELEIAADKAKAFMAAMKESDQKRIEEAQIKRRELVAAGWLPERCW